MNNATAVCQDGPLALICGGGTLPLAVADAAAKRGRDLVLFLISMPSPQWLRAIRITGLGSGNLGHLRGLPGPQAVAMSCGLVG
jgi:DUF1009 family protein